MRLIRKVNTSGSNACTVPMLPVMVQGTLEVAAGDGATAASLLSAPLVAGDPAPKGGYIDNTDLCYDLLVTMTVIHKDPALDCPEPGCPLPASSVVTTDVTFVVDAKSEWEIPEAYWSDLQVTVLDDAGAPVAIVAGEEGAVKVNSCRSVNCACEVLVP